MKLSKEILEAIGELPAQCIFELQNGKKIEYLYVNENGILEGVITGGKEGIKAFELKPDEIKRIRKHRPLSRWKTICKQTKAEQVGTGQPM